MACPFHWGGGGVGTRYHSWLRHRASSRKVVRSIPDGVIVIFRWYEPSGYGPGVDSACNRDEYQEYFTALDSQPYHFYVPIFSKSGSPNLL